MVNDQEKPRKLSCTISGPPQFTEAVEFEFDEDVNIFIGPNATGKSTILKLLCRDFPSDRKGKYVVNWERQEQRPEVYLPPVRDVVPEDPSEYRNLDSGFDEFVRGLVYRAGWESLPDWRESSPPNGNYWQFEEIKAEGWSIDNINLHIGVIILQSLMGLFPISRKTLGDVHEGLSDALGWDDRPYLEEFDLIQLEERREEEEEKAREYLEQFVPEAIDQLEKAEGARFLLNGADPYTSFPAVRVQMALARLAKIKSNQWTQVVRVAQACCTDICPEALIGIEVFRETKTQDGLVTSETSYPGGGASVRGASGAETVSTGKLSTGTQGLWWWICWLALKMALHYDRDGWEQLPAILLIDELENHLHPTWQRRVIPALRKHFPGLQIFATTHSPFVVAGRKRGQIHRLYREKGVIKTDKLTEEEKEQRISGWTVEEILREFMDVDDPTDAETAEAAAKLRWLRDQMPGDGSAIAWVKEKVTELGGNEGERTRNEDEALRWLSGLVEKPDSLADQTALEWWQDTLDTLRSSVSRDIEAGGPLAAQRDLFIAQLREMLADDEADSSDPDREV